MKFLIILSTFQKPKTIFKKIKINEEVYENEFSNNFINFLI
jgi:hypothetical protein